MPRACNGVPSNSALTTAAATSSTLKTVNGSLEFKITGYSQLKGMGIGKKIASETFMVGGYSWAIYFYPNGKSVEDKGTYVSLFIALASDGTDVTGLFELTLMDQSGKGRHIVHSHFEKVLENGLYSLKHKGSMWGYKRFYKRTLLETSDYLKDDTLHVHCRVGLVKTYSIPVPPSDIGQQSGHLLESRKGTDVNFEVYGEKFHAHKLVPAARSPVLTQFVGPLKGQNTQCISIEDMDESVFEVPSRGFINQCVKDKYKKQSHLREEPHVKRNRKKMVWGKNDVETKIEILYNDTVEQCKRMWRSLVARLFWICGNLEGRLDAAKKKRDAPKKNILEKEDQAKKALDEKQLVMENVVQEGNFLRQPEEEDSKLGEFLLDRGRLDDFLQEEISLVEEDVKFLKAKFDELHSLSKSLSFSQTTTCNFTAAFSSSPKSMATEQVDEAIVQADPSETAEKFNHLPYVTTTTR